jgi:hypothetical protein
MSSSYIVEHLTIAKSLAKADGNAFLAYLIELAIDAARAGDKVKKAGRRMA